DLDLWDPRLQDALDIMMSKRLPDGRWNLENSFNGKINVRIEKKGKPSKWITLKALQVLQRFGSHLTE
ncbi:MAG: nitrogen fixation protein NifH, partial [Bacillota bacterium]|nr:nitrogen fixation protein NifH [Bacillota bacterium]